MTGLGGWRLSSRNHKRLNTVSSRPSFVPGNPMGPIGRTGPLPNTMLWQRFSDRRTRVLQAIRQRIVAGAIAPVLAALANLLHLSSDCCTYPLA